MVAAKLVFCYKLAVSVLSWSPFSKAQGEELYWENVRIWGAISHLRLTLNHLEQVQEVTNAESLNSK